VPFTCCSIDDILKRIDQKIHDSIDTGYISVTNTESLYFAIRIPSHFQYIEYADFSCCDGIGIVIGGKMLGIKVPRIHGPDLFLKCCEFGEDKGWRHFFYGGRNGVPELLNEKLKKDIPNLLTCGMYSPPFRQLTPEEDQKIIDLINEAKPDIIWVGLGLLKQERWIAEHLDKIKVSWMVGVGAAFDFHAGTIKRAPRIFQSTGLEWMYRLAFEPRMLKRNFYSFLVVLKLANEALHRRNRH
jgi:N-acetylglucosaminyldiphosphoundecaprenol N-acetyl-beta-D-mannosaminyltransferase